MAVVPGQRLGAFIVGERLGAGGMGEVYRGRDTKLDRDVAIKILPELFTGDPDRLTRFRREAQVLASLNHPHIGHVYGFEDSPGACALVMELVEGDDLAEVIARGPMPLAEVLPIARQIADALEGAHEQGIVHRDLKPANVKVRPDGAVKVLDFGLAKSMEPAAGSGVNVAHSPTLTARATQMGMILGTAAYMAPEQARGKAVDKRADIWAFGVVLFEMLTGRRLFDGEDMTDVLARVLERDPDWSNLPASTPPALRRLLERCLTKDPKARLRDIGEARHALDELIAGRSGVMPAPALPAPPPARRPVAAGAWLPWGLAAALAVVAALSWLRTGGPSPDSRPTRVELNLPDDVEFYTAPHLSPDARRVVFVGVREGNRQAYVRDLDTAETRPIAGTDNSLSVAFSPDAESVAVISADAKLKRISLQTGGVETVASSVDIVGGVHWARDGRIVFGTVTKLVALSTAGGEPREIVAVDGAAGEATITNPFVTPDSKTLLFTSWRKQPDGAPPRIEAVPMAGGPRRLLVENGAYVMGIAADRLIFQRAGAVYAVAFDPVHATVSGTPVKLTDEPREAVAGGLAVDVSPGGHLLFVSTRTFNGKLVWVTLDGTERSIPVPPGTYHNPRVSPDGRMVAYSAMSVIWTVDAERGAQTRIYSGGGSDSLSGFPVWSADGVSLFFRTPNGIMRMRADGEGKAEALPGTNRSDYPTAVSPDNSTLLFTRIDTVTSGDVMVAPLAGGEPRAVVSTPIYEGGGQFSPDGKWLTYVSNSSGRMEVYLRPVEGSERHAVSTAGGLGALWSRDGRRIFFRNGQQFLAVDMTTTPTVQLSAPKVLFNQRYTFGQNITIANYSLSKDGREFLLVTAPPGHLSLIFNWLQNAGR